MIAKEFSQIVESFVDFSSNAKADDMICGRNAPGDELLAVKVSSMPILDSHINISLNK